MINKKYILLLGRVLFSAIFVTGATNHFDQGTIQMAAAHGLPAASLLVPFTGFLMLLGGLSIMLGYRGKTGAWLLVLFLVPATLLMHNYWSVSDPAAAQMQQMMFMKNVTMLGGALYITYFGTGPLSLDNRVPSHPYEGQKPSTVAPAHS